MICPNPSCGFEGKAKMEARGSLIVGVLLAFLAIGAFTGYCASGDLFYGFFLLPGIFYPMLRSGHRYSCPECGLQISVDN